MPHSGCTFVIKDYNSNGNKNKYTKSLSRVQTPNFFLWGKTRDAQIVYDCFKKILGDICENIYGELTISIAKGEQFEEMSHLHKKSLQQVNVV